MKGASNFSRYISFWLEPFLLYFTSAKLSRIDMYFTTVQLKIKRVGLHRTQVCCVRFRKKKYLKKGAALFTQKSVARSHSTCHPERGGGGAGPPTFPLGASVICSIYCGLSFLVHFCLDNVSSFLSTRVGMMKKSVAFPCRKSRIFPQFVKKIFCRLWCMTKF